MSLKFNPFDQRAKGNLIKRRKVFETPPPLSSNEQHSVESESSQPLDLASVSIPIEDFSETALDTSSSDSEFEISIENSSFFSSTDADQASLRFSGPLSDRTIGKSGQLDSVQIENPKQIEPNFPDYQLETNQGQTGDKVETQLETNQGQTGDKVETVKSKVSKSRDKVESQVETQLETNQGQTGDKVETPDDFSSLIGLQKSLMIFLYESCKAARSNQTQKLAIEHLANGCVTSVSSVKKTLQRLEQKLLIKRIKYKDGRGGWTVYELESRAYQDILRTETKDKLETNWRQSRDKVESQLETQLETTASSMYVGINNNTIHTEAGLFQAAPNESDPWSELREVDFSQLHQIGIKATIIDTFKKNRWVIDRFQLEDFIERLHRYMTEPQYADSWSKIKKPYSFFLGAIKDIANGDPHSLCHVKTEYELEKEIALKIKAKQIEEFERSVQAQENRISQLIESQFKSWLETITPDEQISLVPPKTMAKPGSVAYKQLLKAYFTDNIWSKNEHSFLNGPSA